MKKTLLLSIVIFSLQLKAQTRVMSYNIRLDYTAKNSNTWDERKDKIFSQIRENNIDIFGIQEGMPNQMDDFRSSMPEYQDVGVGRDDGSNQGEYSAVFFKKDQFELIKGNTFWLSQTPDIPSKGWDAALNRICTYVQLKSKSNGRDFWVFNTHFDHIGEVARKQSVVLILDKIHSLVDEGVPFILTGDFNLNEDHLSIKLLQEKLNDSRLVAKKVIGTTQMTFNDFNTEKPADRRIDYIFVSEEIRVKSFETLVDYFGLSYPSDHFPIISTLRF